MAVGGGDRGKDKICAEALGGGLSLDGSAAVKEVAREECSIDGFRGCSGSGSGRRDLLSSTRFGINGPDLTSFRNADGAVRSIGSGSNAVMLLSFEKGSADVFAGSDEIAVVDMISPTRESRASRFRFRTTAGSLLSAASV